MAKHVQLSSSAKGVPTSEERPTMKQLQEVMRIKDFDVTRWRDLGLELVDSNKVLKVIEADHPGNIDTCCRVMFEKWLEKIPDASWSQLVAALNNIEMNTAADAVSKLLKPDSANTSDVTSAINFSDCGDNISAAFTLLTTKIHKLLKSADFDALKTAVLQQRNTPKGVQLPDNLAKSITSAQNLGALLNLLVTFKHWNWADLRLLETLVISSDIHAAKVIIDQYKHSIFPIKLSEVLDKLSLPQNEEHRDAYTAKVASKIRKEPDNVTVGDLSYYCNILETVIMDINNCSCVLEHLDQGCLEIHWLIPTHCRFHAYKSALNNRHKFCDIHLQYLEIKPYPPIYDPFTIQPTMLSTLLCLPKPIVSTPAEVIGYYYCFLSDNLDNGVVCKIMLELKVVNEENLIHCAKLHSEYQKNAFLLDQLLVTNKFSDIFEFCHLLHNTDNQQELGHMLVNALESIPTDDMDTEQSSGTSSQSEDGEDICPVYQPEVFRAAKTIHIKFLNLITQLRQNLKVSDPKCFLAACNKLSVSASHLKPIPLLGVGYLQDLDDASSEEIFNQLAILWMWNNCSILRALVEACNCQDGIKMLDDFESQIDATLPMEFFPIPPPSMKMAPSSSSPFTVLSIREEYDRDEPVPLQYVNAVATIMVEKFGISSHALQLLAARANPLMLYWMIPKSIIPLISRGVNEHLKFLKEKRFLEIAIYPSTILLATDNLHHGSFALLSSQPQSVGAEEVAVLKGTSDDAVIKHIYKQNIDLKAEVTRIKSSGNNLANELEKLTEKYSSLSQDFEKSTFISKAEGLMDQLEEIMSKLPLFKKYKGDKDEESATLSDFHDEISISEKPPAFLTRMQIFTVKIKDFYRGLPSKDVKIKQFENTIEELQSELEMKSREIDRLKKENKTLINRRLHQKESKTSNEEDSEMSINKLLQDVQRQLEEIKIQKIKLEEGLVQEQAAKDEIESGAKQETNRIVEEAKEKEKALSLIMTELKQVKTKLEDTIYRLKGASAVKEVALKETQELLKEEKEEVATLKAQMDLVDQSKDSVNIEEVMEENGNLKADLEVARIKIDTLRLKKNIAESKLSDMEREKAIIELELKELISRHRTDMMEKIARLSHAEERLVIVMSRFEEKKQDSEELMSNLQKALDQVEVAEKEAQDAKKQVKKLEAALEHEKQVKTEAINKLVQVSFSKPMDSQAVSSSADVRKKDRDIRKLHGELQKESDKFNNIITKHQQEMIAMQSQITEEQRQRQDLQIELMLREQEIVQLRKGLMTPYVTNKPQIDYPDGQSAQDFSLGVEKDVSWMAIPAGIDTRKHGWRDVFVVLHFARKTLSFFDREDDSSVVAKALFSFDFNQIYHVGIFKNEERESIRVKPKEIKGLLQLSYTAAISKDGTKPKLESKILLESSETTINIAGHRFVEVSLHSPSNCDVCSRPLPWSIGPIGRSSNSVSVECKRCHLRCHNDHALSQTETLMPCVGGERDVKRLYILAKSEDERDHWLAQLSKITLVRDDRLVSPSAKDKLLIGRQKSQRRPSSATKEKASTLRAQDITSSIAMNPQRSASVRDHGRLDQIHSSDVDLTSTHYNSQ